MNTNKKEITYMYLFKNYHFIHSFTNICILSDATDNIHVKEMLKVYMIRIPRKEKQYFVRILCNANEIMWFRSWLFMRIRNITNVGV